MTHQSLRRHIRKYLNGIVVRMGACGCAAEGGTGTIIKRHMMMGSRADADALAPFVPISTILIDGISKDQSNDSSGPIRDVDMDAYVVTCTVSYIRCISIGCMCTYCY